MQNLCLFNALIVLGLSAMSFGLASRLARGGERFDAPGLTVVETVCVDENATGYATFQSHNQKVVSNRNGIFMTHIRSRNEAYNAQQWRLSQSTDGGKTFKTIFEATNATSAPAMETDEQDNIYLARPDFVDGNAYLYRFLAKEQYAKPLISRIPKGSAGKYCMMYDRDRKQLYYFAHNNTFHILSLDGNVRASRNLLRAGESAVLQYPQLSLDRDGALHAAWTTQKRGIYLYWDIHHMLSKDGGETWQKTDGTPLTPPVIADHHGPADRITLDDEYESHTWLSSFMVKDGKLHFVYEAQTKPPREHYVRCDLKAAEKDIDIYPEFKGEEISLLGLDGFLASRISLPNAPLYYISKDKDRIACLASDDNGETWYDYAISEETFHPYAIGGCREITADGYIIGSFTNQKHSPQNTTAASSVYFVKVKAGLSSVKVIRADYMNGAATLNFTDIHGQPVEIRFRSHDSAWGDWLPFKPEMSAKIEARPTQFQLKSRLGVISEACGIGESQ